MELLASEPWEEYNDEGISECSSKVADCTGFWDVDVKGSDSDMELLFGSSTCDFWKVLVGCELVSSGVEVAELCRSSGQGLAKIDEVGSSSWLLWL